MRDAQASVSRVRKWRNWQTRKPQELVAARSWRFESSLPHQQSIQQLSRGFGRRGRPSAGTCGRVCAQMVCKRIALRVPLEDALRLLQPSACRRQFRKMDWAFRACLSVSKYTRTTPAEPDTKNANEANFQDP